MGSKQYNDYLQNEYLEQLGEQEEMENYDFPKKFYICTGCCTILHGEVNGISSVEDLCPVCYHGEDDPALLRIYEPPKNPPPKASDSVEDCDGCRNVTRHGGTWACLVCGEKFVKETDQVLPVADIVEDDCVSLPLSRIIKPHDVKKVKGPEGRGGTG